MRPFLLVSCCLFALLPVARQPGQQQPTFRSRLDVVAVDVHVVDGSGRPVSDLQPDEFTVTVDGRPRSIVAADYVSYASAATTPAATQQRPRPLFTSNRSLPTPRPGRWILLVVDEENIRAGDARQAATAASRFLDQLRPNDRVGLVTLGMSATHVDPTTDRAGVRAALGRIAGHLVPLETMLDAVYHVALSEAFTLRNDSRQWAAIVDRECTKPGMQIPASVLVQGLPEEEIIKKYPGVALKPEQVAGAILEAQRCKGELEHAAMTTMQDVRQRTVTSTRALLALLEAVARVPGPKTVVFISQELPVSNYASERADFNAEISRITPAAAQAQTTFYILHLHSAALDVEGRMAPSASAADADMRTFGLETMTSVTGGKRLMVSGAVEPAMDRIALEISGYYLLGFRAEATDRDGKPHAIKVAVKRAGVELRARPMFAFSDEPGKSAEASAADVVNRLLRTPDAATELPVSVTTYVLPDPASGTAQVRLLVAAEIDRLDAQEAPTTVGYLILDANGRNAGGMVEQLALKAAPADPDHRLQYLAAAVVAPGRYTLRLAAVDGGSRAGSVEHPFEAKLTSAGPLTLGDLVVFDQYPDESGKPRPGVPATVSGSLSCYLEAHSPATALPPDLDIRLEIAETPGAPARAAGTMAAQPSATAGRVPLNGSVPLADLPAGDYVARAIVSSGDEVLGQVTRPVHVVAAPAPVSAAAGQARPPAAEAKPAAAPVAPAPPLAPPAAAATPVAASVASYSTPAKTVEELLQRVGRYCLEYGEQMSLVIGVERYAQWMQNEDAPRPVAKTLVSEFALVRGKGDWDGFRDVDEVDGKPVPDRRDRLLKLFTESPASAMEQSRKIAAESARYNMGSIQRNFNVPTTALFFVKTENQARFKFRKDGEDKMDGATVWKMRYEETRKPTIIRTSQGKDMPVHGTFWIDPVQGRVLKTHMEITSDAMLTADHGGMSNNPGGYLDNAPGNQAATRWGDNRRVNTSASITVTYRQEPNLGLLVPAEMLETYEGPTRSAFTGNESVTKINCRATYSDFKRFETGARVVPK